MALRLTLWVVSLIVTSLAVAQTNTGINCKTSQELCEIDVGGQTLTLGMPKDRALELLSRTSYHLSEDRNWSAQHKPYSVWHLTVPEDQTFSVAVKASVKFKAEKLDGAMVLWSPDSNEASDFATSLINLLERFSKEGSTHCTLVTERTPRPQQEDRGATFQCGMRSVSIEHTRFQSPFKGQKVPDYAAIYEMFANW